MGVGEGWDSGCGWGSGWGRRNVVDKMTAIWQDGGMVIQQFLRSGGSLAELQSKYAVKTSRSLKHPSLVLLKYHQTESPMAERIVQECRGLILDEANNWAVVSRSFDKFFNHGEGHAAAIDWSTARVQEKLDGSLCVLYNYKGEWCVQTSGHPDAGGQVGDAQFTFAELFWRVFDTLRLQLPDDVDVCLSFELMSKWNRVVVQHAEPTLRLIGVRRLAGAEEPVALWADKYPVVKAFELQSLKDITETFRTMEPLKQEGYVVVDGAFNRIKVKHPGYVAHLRDGCSTRRLAEIVQAGEVGEFLAYFPEWTDEFTKIQTGLASLESELEADFARIQPACPIQKDFAHYATKTRCGAALFMLRAGKVASIGEFLRTRLKPDDLLRLIGLRDKVVGGEV